MQRWAVDSTTGTTISRSVRNASTKHLESETDSAARRLGDFELIEEIGRGGMGVIYRAREMSLDRIVALKTLPFAALTDPQRIERFKLEARAAATLQHRHIVPVFSIGQQRGVYFYAMQLIDGPNVAELIAGKERSDSFIETESIDADFPSSDDPNASTESVAVASHRN
ncbi:MAG: hypothetical protein AAFN70_16890, partial [Planctomycetota bacterium]